MPMTLTDINPFVQKQALAVDASVSGAGGPQAAVIGIVEFAAKIAAWSAGRGGQPVKSPWMLAVAALAVVMATTGCSDGPTTGGNSAIPFQEVFKDRYSRITAQRGEVISTPDRWQAVWNELSASVPQPALPVVDFGGASVILAAMGENPDACWTVAIEAVRSRDALVRVTVTNIRSPSSCSCPAVIVQPVHVVSVQTAIDADAVVFEVGTATRGPECN